MLWLQVRMIHTAAWSQRCCRDGAWAPLARSSRYCLSERLVAAEGVDDGSLQTRHW